MENNPPTSRTGCTGGVDGGSGEYASAHASAHNIVIPSFDYRPSPPRPTIGRSVCLSVGRPLEPRYDTLHGLCCSYQLGFCRVVCLVGGRRKRGSVVEGGERGEVFHRP